MATTKIQETKTFLVTSFDKDKMTFTLSDGIGSFSASYAGRDDLQKIAWKAFTSRKKQCPVSATGEFTYLGQRLIEGTVEELALISS